MQINRINTCTNSNYNKNNGHKSTPSFEKLLDPDFANWTVHEIKAYTNSIGFLDAAAKDCNLLIGKGLRMIKAKAPCGATGRKPINAFEIRFSELGSENKTRWQKVKEFFGIKDNGFLQFSEPTEFPRPEKNYAIDNVNALENILKNGVRTKKESYRRFYGLDERDAIIEAKAKTAEISGATIHINSKKK